MDKIITSAESIDQPKKVIMRGWPKGKPRKQKLRKTEAHVILQAVADQLQKVSIELLELSSKIAKWDAAAESLRGYLES